MTLEQLRAWRDGEALKDTGPKFMNIPDAWYEDRHWFCTNGHVSSAFLKSEERGDRCLGCREPVLLGPPIGEDEFARLAPAITTSRIQDGAST
jgi:hypothetical protein